MGWRDRFLGFLDKDLYERKRIRNGDQKIIIIIAKGI
jgi:hypothetical protein